MDAPLTKVDRAALRARLLVEFERTLDVVVEAVDKAPAGRIIRDSEECHAIEDVKHRIALRRH